MSSHLKLGKYRDIVLAIALFITLLIGVLLFNVYTTFVFDRDITLVNLAGKQRLLSQTILSEIVLIQQKKRDNTPFDSNLNELHNSVVDFDNTLTKLTNLDKTAFVFRVFGLDDSSLAADLAAMNSLWSRHKTTLKPLLSSNNSNTTTTTPEIIEGIDINSIAAKVINVTPQLVTDSNHIVIQLQINSSFKSKILRILQLVMIAIALTLLAYILFNLIERLNNNDQTLEISRRQTTEILNTVDEGLLLIDRHGKIGSQMSKAVRSLLGREVLAGEDFRSLLSNIIDADRIEEINLYIDLLLDPKVKPLLLTQLDPMKEVPITIGTGTAAHKKHFHFKLNQLRNSKQVTGLLVTIFDITAEVNLRQALANSQVKAKSDIEDLLQIFDQDPDTLQDFLTVSKKKLSHLNEAMRTVGKAPKAYHSLLQSAALIVHGIKGESAALNLTAISTQSHTVEDVLATLIKKPDITGENLIPIAYELSLIHEQIERIERLFNRLTQAANKEHRISQYATQIFNATTSIVKEDTEGAKKENSTPANLSITTTTNISTKNARASTTPTKLAATPALSAYDKAMFDLHVDKAQPSTKLQIANPQAFNAPSLSELRAEIPELSPATVLYSVRLSPLDEMVLNLEKLATTIAVSLDKKVTLRIDIPAIEVSKNLLRILREVLPQLIRNSVVHGIEDKNTRQQLNKPEIGKIYFAIRKIPNNVTEVSLQDDGAGITVEAVRARLHTLNIDTSQMSNSQILQYIFKPQFSTASNITEHAGRGIGLALVKHLLEQAGASLKVHTRPGESTQFLMRFGANV